MGGVRFVFVEEGDYLALFLFLLVMAALVGAERSPTAAAHGRSTTHVSFVCQKCSAPVKLNRSLNPKSLLDLAKSVESKLSLTPSTGEEEKEGEKGEEERNEGGERPKSKSDPGVEHMRVSRESETVTKPEGSERARSGCDEDLPPFRRPRSSPQTRSRRKVRNSVETLSVLYDSLPIKTEVVSTKQDSKSTLKQIQIASETFKLLSSLTEVDHPVCSDCPEAQLDAYEEEILAQQRAKNHYKALAEKLEKEVEEYKSQIPELDHELEEMRTEEEALREKLVRMEKKRQQVAAEMAKQRERERNLSAEEQQYWEAFNNYQGKVLEFKDEQRSAEYQLHYSTEQLERLKKTNVLNAAFHIWHNGHFGTINGLRLGRLQTVPVEWNEINAALGQAAFLLVTLARNAGARFQRYRVVPYGNQSFVEVLEGKKKSQHWPLHSSAGLRIFADSKFDLGLVAFLDCLGQFKDHIERASGGRFGLPYSIVKDRIGNGKEFYSVKTQFNTLEGWTKALKFVLTDLRWALTWISSSGMRSLVE